MNRLFNSILKTNNRCMLLQWQNGVCAGTIASPGSKNDISNLNMQHKRFLFSKTILGVDGYLLQRERTLQQLSNITKKFREKMHEYTQPGSNSMIFTEDLKNMAHMAETTDIELLKLMIGKFNSQNQELRFGSFVFGPVVMRMFHHLNIPDSALECFLDPSLSSFFCQSTTYTILLDLLFINGKYKEILLAYDTIRERQVAGTLGTAPRNVIVLALAACYRLGNENAVERALTIWRESNVGGTLPTRRAATFLAGLCVINGRPQVAHEIISSCNNQNYTTIRNIKVLALCQLDRRDDVITILRSVFSHDDYAGGKHTFNRDVIEEVDKNFEAETSAELKTEYSHIRKQLDAQNLITETKLNEQLCSEISLSINNQENTNQRFNRFSNRPYDQDQTYRRQSSNNNSSRQRRFTRPGLSEM